MKRNFLVFISYSDRDREAAARVARALRDEGFNPWLSSEIPPGTNWAEETAKALDRSEAIVILISPDFMNSAYARREIDFALSGEKFNRRVIPVLLRPTAQIPWILNRLHPINAKNIDRAAQQVVKALRESIEAPAL